MIITFVPKVQLSTGEKGIENMRQQGGGVSLRVDFRLSTKYSIIK